MKNKEIKSDVIILGGGISGLSAAHLLAQKGKSIVVLEKAGRVGGAIQSAHKDGFLIEYGPNSILDTTPILTQMAGQLGIKSSLVYANSKAADRYILRSGKLIPVPMSPPAFLASKLFSLSAKLRLLKEPFVKRGAADIDESLADFVRRRLGEEFLDYAINPFVAGVYAGKPEMLSVVSAFPKLHQIEQKYGSLIKGQVMSARRAKKSSETAKTKARLLSFVEGLQTFIDALENRYQESIFTNSKIRSISRNKDGYLVSCINNGDSAIISAPVILNTLPAPAWPSLPFTFDVSKLTVLKEVYYPPVAMVFFGYKHNPGGRSLDGFGYLIPEKEKRNTLGTIWSSTIFPKRAPQGGAALTTFVGGSRQPENALLSNGELEGLVFSELKYILNINKQPDFVEIKKWEKAIPQYQIGHQHIIKELETFENNHPGFYISGNFRGGISVGDRLKQSLTITEKILLYLVEHEGKTNIESRIKNIE